MKRRPLSAAPNSARLTLRRPRHADLPALVAMMAGSNTVERGFSPDLCARRFDWRHSWRAFKRDLGGRSTVWWLASAARTPVGMIGVDLTRLRHRYHPVRRRVYVHSLYVVPAWRRRGVGRRLVAHALHRARRWGAQQALLEMAAGNHRAQRLYEDFGFRVREFAYALALPQSPPPPR
jgi:ribosomal protein S18 acetylase RimI-like enzyme